MEEMQSKGVDAMHTLSESELTAVAGGALKIPDPYPSPFPEEGGIPKPDPIFPSLYGSGSIPDYSLWKMF